MTGGNLALPDMDQAAQKGAGGENDGAAAEFASIRRGHTGGAAALHQKAFHRGGADGEVFGLGQCGLHGGAVELAVGLRPGAAHRRALAPVQHAELDARRIGDAAHHAVQRIDLAHQMALPHPANGRIAGHFADGFEIMGQKQRCGACACGCRRGLTAGVPAPDHDHVVTHGRGV